MTKEEIKELYQKLKDPHYAIEYLLTAARQGQLTQAALDIVLANGEKQEAE